ncbi:MAG: DUF2298 domain-containing protein [Chloroflexota bacterium]
MTFDPQDTSPEDLPEPAVEQDSGPLPVPPSVPMPPRRRRSISRQDLIAGALLIVILIVGAYFRFVGQNWDDYTHLHPDERFLTGVTESLGGALNPSGDATRAAAQQDVCKQRYPETGGVSPSIFDSLCSTMYPKNANNGTGLYVYGELPLFVVKYAADLTSYVHMQAAAQTPDTYDDIVAQNWTQYNGVQLVGRSVSAIAELLSLIFVFLIGRRLYNVWVGLLAAALATAAVLPIQLSHYWTTDAFTNLPVLIAFWFAVRVMDRGKAFDFVGFGIALGAAMASRINTLPLFGVGVLAAIIYALPALDMSLISSERGRLVRRAVLGCVVAFIFTGISFRITMPHAFVGGPGVLGFFDIGNQQYDLTPGMPSESIPAKVLNTIFYHPWLNDLGQASMLSSGQVDFPPDHQWASRTPYLFPLRNIVLWGMGVPLGLAACLGWLWASVQILRARPLWTRHILLVVWILVYFGYMGRQWVMTMRYYMPLYPFMILLAAWAIYELCRRSWAWFDANPMAARRGVAFVGTFVLVFVLVGTYLWGTMFTSIYRRQLTRVEASRWITSTLPSAISTTLTMSSGKTLLVNFQTQGNININITHFQSSEPKLVNFIPSARTPIDRVNISHVLDSAHDGKPKRLSVAITQNADGTQVIGHGSLESDFSTDKDPLGMPTTVMLDEPIVLNPLQTYYLMSWTESNLSVVRQAPDDTVDFTLSDANGDTLAQAKLPDADSGGNASASFADQPANARIRVAADGTIDHFNFAHMLNLLNTNSKANLTLHLMSDDRKDTLAQATFSGDISSTKTSMYGDSYSVALDKPVALKANQPYWLDITSTDGTPVQVTGTVIANEGPWDDPVPWKVCPLPPDMELTHDTPSGVSTVNCEGIDGFAWYKGPELQMALEDIDQKRGTIQTGLDQSDYFTISSNRFYDTVTRLPLRYPMSIAFYKALFSGQLGFDLIKTVTSYPSIGNFEIADQYLPTYTAPPIFNEWESEEAFSVYDHPTVFIFKKSANYNPKTLAAVLNSVSTASANDINIGKLGGINMGQAVEDPTLINRITWDAADASHAPTGFQLTDLQRLIQTQGGTWKDLFNRDWSINTSPILAVVVWWVTMLLFGFAAWPIVFTILPGLPDRGYPIAKIGGLLIVAWIVWAGATLHLLTWTQVGIALTLIAMALVSFVVALRNRVALLDYVRLNWRHMVIIELITLVLFLAFLFVRLGNPDLWAQSLGGEKPMDFAYFNAVLRSTIFPPYDPWYAGGYLNYYYFGFVLVGAPVKLLGVMPSVAYNLIIPTLFALTGIGAFCVAFNIVASRWFFPRDDGDENDEALSKRRRFALRTPPGSPYLAGMMALLLCVVLGNLDTPRQILTGVTRAGGYSTDSQGLYQWKLSEFVRINSRQPNSTENDQLVQASDHPSLSDQLQFGMQDSQRVIGSFGRGIAQVIGGGLLPISPDRWFWGPRSIVGELPNSSNEINEMPSFTFIFGDLHAHMLAFPLTLLALAWLLSEVLAAGYIQRPTITAITATVFGGLIIGTLQATNTWDWFTYLLLAILALIFVGILRWQHAGQLGRRMSVAWGAQLGGFLAAQWCFALPFTLFWSTSYLGNNAIASFKGEKTPIWAYLDIHGIFLFILISFLIWQTGGLLRRVYVRDLIGKAGAMVLLATALGIITFLTLVLAVLPLQVSLFSLPIPLSWVCLPMLGWCAILFFLPDQSRENRVIYTLIGLALGVSYGVEVVVLGADIGRQNTFFKFYLQAWILFSIASGVAIAWLFNATERWRPVLRASWLGVLAVLLSIGGLFPILATQGKVAMRMATIAPHTLDGDAYMNYAIYYEGSYPIPLSDDLSMIKWLQDNVKGSPVILEGYMSEYKLGARIAINTGLPTLLGWKFHQQQQRTLDPLPNLVWQRIANITEIYNTTDIPTAWKMLKFFHVQYIVVGKLENVVYVPEGQAKWNEMIQRNLIKVVYENNGDHIYQVISDVTLPDTIAGGG